jgi:RNA polymerase sigma-70 factor (ECF subfamily)
MPATLPATDRRGPAARSRRRAADRRAPSVVASPPDLPRKARAYAERLTFIEQIEPAAVDLEEADTERLIVRFQDGDHEAFASLYVRYFDRVYSYLVVVLASPHEAEDGTQEVFAKLWRALPNYEHRENPFPGWLFTIARNHAINQLRKRVNTDVMDPMDMGRTLDAHQHEDDLSALGWINDSELLLFIERLPVAQREVLVLRYMMDLPYAQIAAILNRSVEDVRSLNSRGVRFLRKRLTAIGRIPSRPRARMRRRVLQAPVLRQRRFGVKTRARRTRLLPRMTRVAGAYTYGHYSWLGTGAVAARAPAAVPAVDGLDLDDPRWSRLRWTGPRRPA